MNVVYITNAPCCAFVSKSVLSPASLGHPSHLSSCRPQIARSRRVTTSRAHVRFTITKKVSFGDRLCLVGDHEKLGNWSTDDAAELKWSDGHVWTADMDIPEDSNVEYKVVNVKGQGDPRWEKGGNRTLTVGAEDVVVDMAWDRTGNGAGGGDGYNPLHDVAGGDNSPAIGMLPQNGWQGKHVEFMQENRHSHDRHGSWNTDGLTGPVLALVKGDERSGRYATRSMSP